MAHIQINGNFPKQIIINGVDYSRELFREVELIEVGDDPQFAEVGLRVTFAVGRLDLDAEADVQITDRLPEVAQRVRTMSSKEA